MTKLIFENRAWEEADTFRLCADCDKEEKPYRIKALEISEHRTSPNGHIFVEEYCYRMDGDRKTCIGKMHLFKTYEELEHFISNKYGASNIEAFKAKIIKSIEVMLNDKYVKQWKGIK